jgi:ubiquinone biosynthesis protein UbiJ
MSITTIWRPAWYPSMSDAFIETVKLVAPAFPLDLVNRALAREASLRARLATHAGAGFTLASGALHTRFVIEPDGRLAFPVDDSPPTLTLRVAPTDIPALLHDPGQFDARVHADGDAALATTLKEIAQTFPWFVERALASAFGAVAGQRLAEVGRAALGFPGQAAARLRTSVSSYLRDEADLLVRKEDAASWAADANALAARVDALALRVQGLERTRKARSPA